MNKKFLRLAIASLFFAQTATAQIVDREVSFNYVDGADYSTNYVKNPSAKKNTLNTSVSNATLIRDTTNKFENVASFSVDTSAQNGYAEYTLNTVYDPATSGNCEFKGMFKGDGSLYRAQILDGSNVVLNQTPVLGNSSIWTTFSVTYPCGASGARKVRVTQTEAGTSPAINLAKLYYGVATNVSNSSNVITDWQSYTPSLKGSVSDPNIGSTGTATGRYRIVGGNIEVQASISISGTGISVGSGTYYVTIPAGFLISSVATQYNGTSQVFDSGVYDHYGTTLPSSTINGIQLVISDNISGNSVGQNFPLTNWLSSGDVINIYSTAPLVGGFSRTVVSTSNAADLLGTVFYTGSATCPTGSIDANGAAVSRTTYAPLFAKIGTTHGSGNGSTTFNVPNLDGVFVRGTGSQTIGSETYSGGSLGVKQNDATSKNGLYDQGHAHTFSTTQGSSNDFSTPRGGLNVYAGTATTSTNSANLTSTDAETRPANISMKACIWTVSQNAPVLVGSVTSGSTGVEKTERIRGVCSSSSTISSQSSNFSIGNISSGLCAITLNGFSSSPTCVISRDGAPGSSQWVFGASSTSATNLNITCRTSSDTACTSFDFKVICMGPR